MKKQGSKNWEFWQGHYWEARPKFGKLQATFGKIEDNLETSRQIGGKFLGSLEEYLETLSGLKK